MKTIIYITILIFHLGANFLFSQGNIDDPVPIPAVFQPSPNVAQMNQYLNQSVNYSTGIPEISIPIYTVSVGDIKIPISLDYFAGGIKVDQDATNVGLGWSLTAGGVISREIRGIIDDYLSDSNSNFGGVIFSPTSLEQYAEYTIDPDYDYLLGALEQDNQVDLEPDLFNLIFPEGGGQFIYNQNLGEFNELNRTNIKFEYFYNTSSKRIYNWKVTSENGIMYSFGEESSNGYSYTEKNNMQVRFENTILAEDNKPIGVASWFLRNITDSRGTQVNFSYLNNNDVEYYSRLPVVTNSGATNNNNNNVKSLYSISTVEEKILDEINFSLGKVKFEYSETLREDLKNSRKLESITVFNKLNEPVKTIKFNYSYFTSTENNGLPGLTDNPYMKKRLRLDSVFIKGNEQDTEPLIYGFEYDETALPTKFSYAQDYWGGFNGETENKNFLPQTTYFNPGGSSSFRDIEVSSGAERSVNKDYVTAGMLKKVIYPGSGFTIYEFEPNTASEIQFVEEAPTNNMALYTKLYTKNIKNPYNFSEYEFYSDADLNGVSCNKVIDSDVIAHYECPFTIENPLQWPLLFNEDLSSFNCPEGSVKTPTQGHPSSDEIVCNFLPPYFKRASDQLYDKIEDGEWMFMDPTVNPNDKNLQLIIRFNGNVEILDNNYGSHPNERANFNALVDVKEDINPKIRYVGGLRVKKIENFDTGGELVNSRTFDYEFEDEFGNTLSSGLTLLPQFAMFYPYKFYPDPFDGELITVFFLVDTNLNLLSNGKTYYEKVVENYYDVNDLNPLPGRRKFSTEYFYRNNTFRYSDENFVRDETNLIKRVELMDVSWDNKLESVITRNSDNEIVKNDETIYNRNHGNTGRVIFSGFRLFNLSLKFPQSTQYLVQDYNTFSSFSNTHSQEATEIFNNGVITNKTRYYYNSVNPLLPSSKEITNSLGETIKTEFKYPQDLTQNYEQSVVMNKMVNKNQVATPIITKTHNNNTVISEQRTLYEEIGSTILPKSVYAKKGEMSVNVSTEDRKITYDQYDTKGNLLQYTLENSVPVSIIWGYDGQYPIAKIEGVGYDSLPASVIVALINLSNSEQLQPESFYELINSVDGMVTAYIYEPLVGVTTIIQPNGQYEKYIYDDAGRLKQVQDEQGRVLKEAGYHYYNPQP